MQDMWIESFYNEIDAEKRQAFLKEHTGDPKDELDEFREKLWIARYGKRKPKNDAFVGYLMHVYTRLPARNIVQLSTKSRKHVMLAAQSW